MLPIMVGDDTQLLKGGKDNGNNIDRDRENDTG
jgi:hypothetical protein